MSVTKSRIPFTYEDYKSLPESMDRRYELMDGELCVVPAPTIFHQVVEQNIVLILALHVRAVRCGRVLDAPVDVVLGTGARRDVVQPDIVFISNARSAIVTETEIAGAPDFVIEILSRGTKTRDRGYKRTLYERSGVLEYWIVDPEHTSIEVFLLGVSGFEPSIRYTLEDEIVCTVISDLHVPLVEVFRN